MRRTVRQPLTILLGCALLLTVVGRARADAPTVRVELLTMSRATPLFARFGHAAFRVGVDDQPTSGIVYNFGYTRFDSGDLVWRFLRGEARFWVALASMQASLSYYGREQRGLWRHPLNLTADEHRQLAELLRVNHLPQNRYYTYHHFDDNCATRLRDLLDHVLDGALRRAWTGQPAGGLTHRELMRQGFAGRLDMLLLAELLVGRRVDRPIDRWQAAFLPGLLADQLQRFERPPGAAVAGPLLGPAEVLLPPPEIDPVQGDPQAGVLLLWALATMLSLLAGGAWLGLLRRRRWAGLCLVPQALVVGLAGTLVYGLAAVSTLSEMRGNELLLLLWPAELGLLWLVVRLLRGRFFAGRLLRGYCTARLAISSLAVVCHLVGLLHQQPRAWLLLSWLPALLLWLAVRRLPPATGAPGSVSAE